MDEATEIGVTPVDDVFVGSDSQKLLRFGALLTGNRDDAEDLLQEARARYWAVVQRGVEVRHPTAYMRRLMTTEFLNGRQRRLVLYRILPVLGVPAVAEVGSDPDDRDHVRRALARLPQKQRVAIVLRFYLDLSFAAIGDEMDCPPSTARTLVARGLARLRLDVNEEGQ